MIKKVIFDIDYTLLVPNYDDEKEFFKNSSMNDYFLNHIGELLEEYERTHTRYEVQELLHYLSQYSSKPLQDDFLYNWFSFNTKLKEQDVSESKEILQYCKQKGLEVVALTNWFTEVQRQKLEKVGLSSYFDEIYGGDVWLKPHRESYLTAIGSRSFEECIMIGDHLFVDVMAPAQLGMHAIHYTQKDVQHEYEKVKKLTEIKKYF